MKCFILREGSNSVHQAAFSVAKIAKRGNLQQRITNDKPAQAIRFIGLSGSARTDIFQTRLTAPGHAQSGIAFTFLVF